MHEPFISVIIPVKNEAKLLERCLDSLARQSYPRERFEVIIADGCSTDGTREVALRFGARVVENAKQVVVSGRNCGFSQARGSLIAFTDADCTFDAAWLRSAAKYFAEPAVSGVGCITLHPQDGSCFERAVGIFFGVAAGAGATVHLQQLKEVRQTKDLPGCNAFYRAETLSAVMPLEESFLTAEDVWMNYCLNERGARLYLAPDVVVTHYRRSHPAAFLRQIYRFGIGRAQVGRRRRSLLSAAHVGAALAPLLLLSAAAVVAAAAGAIWSIAGAALVAAVLFFLGLRRGRSAAVAGMFVLVCVLFLTAWPAGVLREWCVPLKDIRGR